MMVRILSLRAVGKVVLGLAAMPALAACNPVAAPAPQSTETSPEEQAAEARAAKAAAEKAEREARLASFYGGGAPSGEPTKAPDADTSEDTPSPPPVNVEPANAPPPPPPAPNAPPPPAPVGPPIQ